jgi:hypothetical protein
MGDGSIISPRLITAMAISLLALANAAWGRRTGSHPIAARGASQEKNACALITKAEVETIMGFPVLSPQARPAESVASGVTLPGEVSSSFCVFAFL